MAVYRNDTDHNITVAGLGTLVPGQSGTPNPDRYLEFAESSGLTLVSETPPQWKIYSASSGNLEITDDLSNYKTITVKNLTDAVVLVAVNGYNDYERLPVVAGEISIMKQDREIRTMKITGSGSGNVYVVCNFRR